MTKRGLRCGHVIAGILLAATMLCGCGKTERIEPENHGNAANGEIVLESTAALGDAVSENVSPEDVNTAPDFTVELGDGSQFTLSDSKGKVVLINIWATWCGPCCAEMPAFQRLYEEYGDELQIVAVNYAEKRKDVDKFIADNGYTFPFAYDEEAKIMGLYPSDGIPYTIIIDKEGKVFRTFLGARSAEEQYEAYHGAIEEAMDEEE
ncbi:MAG: TlpA family protein disulfide reductase [Acetatifactor sp.]